MGEGTDDVPVHAGDIAGVVVDGDVGVIPLVWLDEPLPHIGYRHYINDEGKLVFNVCVKTSHQKYYFRLCEYCGSQITDRRRVRSCSKGCEEKLKTTWRAITEKKERETPGLRATFFWWKFKQECFERDNFTCQKCGRVGKTVTSKIGDKKTYFRSTEDFEAHHIKQIKDGGTNELSNLQTLCWKCHHKDEHSKDGNIRRKHKPLVTE